MNFLCRSLLILGLLVFSTAHAQRVVYSAGPWKVEFDQYIQLETALEVDGVQVNVIKFNADFRNIFGPTAEFGNLVNGVWTTANRTRHYGVNEFGVYVKLDEVSQPKLTLHFFGQELPGLTQTPYVALREHITDNRNFIRSAYVDVINGRTVTHVFKATFIVDNQSYNTIRFERTPNAALYGDFYVHLGNATDLKNDVTRLGLVEDSKTYKGVWSRYGENYVKLDNNLTITCAGKKCTFPDGTVLTSESYSSPFQNPKTETRLVAVKCKAYD